MAEVEFERGLERLFSVSAQMPDGDAFAERVRRRLDRGWAARRALIGAAGLIGGVIGASQLFLSNLFRQAEFTAMDSTQVLAAVRQAVPQADWLLSHPAGIETILVAAALALLALGFAVTRIIEEI